MQNINPLSERLIIDLEAKRKWVRDHYEPGAISNYETIKGKLYLLDSIINANWIEKTETIKLQCLGITFGDVFVQDMDFEWVQIEKDGEIDVALQLPGTSIILFPQTMISKRIERGEDIDIYHLFITIKDRVEELRNTL